jgi:lantibiotic transport system ATP-binding protein
MSELAIETKDLRRTFGKVKAVDGLDLQVPSGTVYGFLGPNGAGKTTTIRTTIGLIKPDSGEIRIFGRSLRDDRLGTLRRIGSLVETPSLYPHLTGRENLEVIRRLVGVEKAEIGRVLAIVNLEADAGRPVKGYSLGMKQRLGLAQALLRQPDLLTLDEPTNGLDPAGIREMRDLIGRLPKEHGITVFLSSHLLNEVEQMADYIGIVQSGRLLFQGTLDELQVKRQQRLVLGVGQPRDVVTILTESGWDVQYNGNGTVIIPSATKDDAAKINGFLVCKGFAVYKVALEQPSLEETFINLTTQVAG